MFMAGFFEIRTNMPSNFDGVFMESVVSNMNHLDADSASALVI
jgi:hypothetical protein